MDNTLNERSSEIEDSIAAGRMTPAQVFTQMRALVRASIRETAQAEQAAARYEYIRARYLSDDMEAPFLPDDATYANTPEEFDAAIDAAITALEFQAGREAADEPYEDPSAIFGDPRA